MVGCMSECTKVGPLATEIPMSAYQYACSLLVPCFELNLPLHSPFVCTCACPLYLSIFVINFLFIP